MTEVELGYRKNDFLWNVYNSSNDDKIKKQCGTSCTFIGDVSMNDITNIYVIDGSLHDGQAVKDTSGGDIIQAKTLFSGSPQDDANFYIELTNEANTNVIDGSFNFGISNRPITGSIKFDTTEDARITSIKKRLVKVASNTGIKEGDVITNAALPNGTMIKKIIEAKKITINTSANIGVDNATFVSGYDAVDMADDTSEMTKKCKNYIESIKLLNKTRVHHGSDERYENTTSVYNRRFLEAANLAGGILVGLYFIFRSFSQKEDSKEEAVEPPK
jgi:hypothetical protein